MLSVNEKTLQDFDTEEEYHDYWVKNIWDGKAQCDWCGERFKAPLKYGHLCSIKCCAYESGFELHLENQHRPNGEIKFNPEDGATVEQVKNFLILTEHPIEEVCA